MRLILVLLMLLAPPVAAQDLAGRWILTAEGRAVTTLTLSRDARAPVGWHARIARMQGWIDGNGARDLRGPVSVTTPAIASASADTLRFRDGDAGEVTFHAIAPGLAEWRGGTAATTPQLWQRASASTPDPVPRAFDRQRVYALDAPWPVNSAMTALFDADQADREAGPRVDWKRVWPRDTARRGETQALLDAGALHGGDDFYHAAYVFQHGNDPADYLTAHALAVIAAARGRRDAAWIAAASLDRYLQSIGRPQVYGTQFTTPPGGHTTQEPYDRAYLSDALRAATGVPSLAEQERQREKWDADYKAPAK